MTPERLEEWRVETLSQYTALRIERDALRGELVRARAVRKEVVVIGLVLGCLLVAGASVLVLSLVFSRLW
jgi:hypothetical protein